MDRLILPSLQRLYIDAGEVGRPEIVVNSMCDMLERSSAPLSRLALQIPPVQDETLLRCMRLVPFLESLSFSPYFFDPVSLLDILTVCQNSELEAALCPRLQELTLRHIALNLRPALSQLLLSRSPPDEVKYGPSQLTQGQFKTPQVARYGTRVLHVLNIANRFDSGSFANEDGLSFVPVRRDDVDKSLVEGEMIAGLVSQGLKVAFNTCWFQ